MRKGAHVQTGQIRQIAQTGQISQVASPGRIAQLEAMVGKLRASLVAEAKRRKLDQRVLAEAERHATPWASRYRRCACRGQSSRRRLSAWRTRTARSSRRAGQRWPRSKSCVPTGTRREEVRRTSAELAKLARESATRAREIVHGRGLGLEPHHDSDVEGVDPQEIKSVRGRSVLREKPPI